MPIKAEVKAETSDVMKSVDEDRKYVIQATIVRIMKARKTMKNQPLIQEVISQISQRFAPKIPDIKKAIDTLLEKEYIERVEGTRDTFNYVVCLCFLNSTLLYTNNVPGVRCGKLYCYLLFVVRPVASLPEHWFHCHTSCRTLCLDVAYVMISNSGSSVTCTCSDQPHKCTASGEPK
jgi:hypothetical protein